MGHDELGLSEEVSRASKRQDQSARGKIRSKWSGTALLSQLSYSLSQSCLTALRCNIGCEMPIISRIRCA